MSYNVIGTTPLLKQTSVNSNYSLGVSDTPVILVDASSGPITVTLFASDTQIDDDKIHRFWVHKLTGPITNPVTVVVAGAENFSDGLSKYILYEPGSTIQLGNTYQATNPGWLRISNSSVVLQTRRVASWSASNFSSATAVPFDIEDESLNSDVLEWLSGSNTRHTAKLSNKRYALNWGVGIDSTGGGTWNLEGWLRVNGTTEIPGSRRRTGNYGGEDGFLEMGTIDYELASTDYVELVIDHNGLTGNLISAILRSCIVV